MSVFDNDDAPAVVSVPAPAPPPIPAEPHAPRRPTTPAVKKPLPVGCRGMTWRILAVHPEHVRVGADNQTNAYKGDTACSDTLPVLCLRKTGAPRPQHLGISFNRNNGWAEGTVGLTKKVSGHALTSLDVANELCRSALGDGYRMIEHHDGGGGWHMWALGDLPLGVRAWAAIHDQRANPWNSVSKQSQPASAHR